MQPGGRCRYRPSLTSKDRLIPFAIQVGRVNISFNIRRQRRMADGIYGRFKRGVAIEPDDHLSVVAFFKNFCGPIVREPNPFSSLNAFAGTGEDDPVSFDSFLDQKKFNPRTGFGTAEKPGREYPC